MTNDQQMKFIGIDLGWSSGASGLCCLEWEREGLRLLDLGRETEMEEILKWVDRMVPEGEAGMVAVDAPTIIPNATGMRVADKLTHKYFGRYHAGCYPASLQSKFAQRTVGLGKSLEARGFAHGAEMVPKKRDRYQIEVFPHPATINLFKLERILKYKKGKLAQRRLELMKLRQYMVEILPGLSPSLGLSEGFWICGDSSEVFNGKVKGYSGKELKAVEDQLDALLCAYIGAYWWYWGSDRNQVLGDRSIGYIVIPIAGMEKGQNGNG